MTDLEQLEVVQFFLLMGLLWFGYSYIYKRTRCDRFREDLFTIRDTLFDYMWQHKLPYNLPAYQLMRYSLNGMIRTAHLTSFSLVTFFLFLTRGRRQSSALCAAIHQIEDGKTKEHFEMLYWQLGKRVFSYLFLEGLQWIVGKPAELYLKRAKVKGRQRQTQSGVSDDTMAKQIRDDLVNKFIVLGKRDSPEARGLARVASIRTR